jgi:hypothetical protein
MVFSAEEFVRINIQDTGDNTTATQRPSGGTPENPTVSGSRASPKVPWSVRHTLKNDGTGTFRRITRPGDDTESNQETEHNYIRPD